MCHTEQNYLTHVTVLNRINVGFFLNRDFNLYESFFTPNIWDLESPGLGTRALKGQAVAVVPNRSGERKLVSFTQYHGELEDRHSTILPCCVLVEHLFLYSVYFVESIVFVRRVIPTSPTPCSSQQNTGSAEVVWESFMVLLYVFHHGRKKRESRKHQKIQATATVFA